MEDLDILRRYKNISVNRTKILQHYLNLFVSVAATAMESTEDSEQTAGVEIESAKAGVFKMPVGTTSLAMKKKSAEVARAFTDNDLDKCDTEPSPSVTVDSSLSNQPLAQTDGAVTSKSVISGVKQKLSSKSFSPAEQLKESEAVIPYKEPPWSGITDKPYYFEVVKNGAVTDHIELTTKSYYVFGRLPSCDHSMDHPSLSRYHAVIQHCAKTNSEGHDLGWYLYDLDSTHGTWMNKSKVTPRVYHRLRVGYVVKFGGSTRLYILQVSQLNFYHTQMYGWAKLGPKIEVANGPGQKFNGPGRGA